MSQTSGSGRKLFIGLLAVAALVAAGIGVKLLLDRGKPAPPPGPEGPMAVSGEKLYTQHCAACHGEKGDGKGPAARFLYPKPRNFGEGRFRLVTTTTSIPSDDDLFRVITRGMPGSAMIPFGHLSEAERRALTAQVRQLIRTGIEEALHALSPDSKPDPELVAELTRPGDLLAVPGDWPASSPESIARGVEIYRRQGCATCHGDTGKGDGVQEQKDSDGTPTRPRDFTRGIFKGGREHAQLYARIRQGMAGTPMPSSELSPAQIGDVINFVLSLTDPAAQARVEHKRALVTARRVKNLPAVEVPDEMWSGSQPVPIVVSPLWWRDYVPPDLRVEAVHDGTTIALRLRWQDETRNDLVQRPEDFEDMAAIQLFKGSPEPFLGMGTEHDTIDLWLWRASWQQPVVQTDSILDDYPFDMPIYREVVKKDKGVPDFLTARAAGNPNTNADRKQSASSLAARGFGSTTFRPKTSQVVAARSAFKDGHWSVVLRRPLAVRPDDGLPVAAGEQCSIAFAVWDGAARDRNGQKLVSIWHDLKLE